MTLIRPVSEAKALDVQEPLSHCLQRILLCDIDHTLANAAWRDPMMGNWDEYHLASREDKPIKPAIALVQALALQGWLVIGNTTRPEKWRQLTLNWLVMYSVPFEFMLMRPEGDFGTSPQVKTNNIKRYFDPCLFHQMLVLDDREDVIAAFREMGIPSLQTRF